MSYIVRELKVDELDSVSGGDAKTVATVILGGALGAIGSAALAGVIKYALSGKNNDTNPPPGIN